LPGSIAPSLGVIAQLGVVLYMFLVGLELDLAPLRRRAHATIAVSHASILLTSVGLLILLPLFNSANWRRWLGGRVDHHEW
jgi:Kef-type K+ transport system membrane component KefB